MLNKRHWGSLAQSFIRFDFRASITVFFVALPLCLGISLASGAPVYSGLLSGIIGGVVISLISRSPLSVSGPAAGLTAICAAAITGFASLDLFFLAVALAGIFQIILGIARLGSFTHFIPSSVIKGMLSAIGIILIIKQIPLIIGYDQPDFWAHEFFNILTLNNVFGNISELYRHTSGGAVLVSCVCILIMITWKKFLDKKIPVVPTSFVTVAAGVLLAWILQQYAPQWSVHSNQFVNVPADFLSQVKWTNITLAFEDPAIWRYGIIICFVASLETLLSITAIDKLDPYNRITPQNHELIAQGSGNFLSGMLGGLPITAVIVRSSANAEAGARTQLSSIAHGFWILIAIVFAVPLLNRIPYAVLAVILFRTGYNLAKPSMILAVYRQGREQFIPFVVTVVAILFTDLLAGVLIGCVYALYFLIKHTYRAGYTLKVTEESGVVTHYIDLALNVSFLNKKRFLDLLDQMPENSTVIINGADNVYIDRDILEIFHDFKSKAFQKQIHLTMIAIPDVETIELH